MEALVLAAATYLLGGLPTKEVVLRLWKVDLNMVGSGNAGAGNAARSVGLAAGVALAVLDGLKGLVPVVVAQGIGLTPGAVAFVGLAAVAGNDWPAQRGRRGGRGLATSVGVVLGFAPALILWPGMWSAIGWRIGGGFAGFFGWGLLPLVAIVAGVPTPTLILVTGLAVMMAVRRAQGNAGYDQHLAAGRVVFDDDRRAARLADAAEGLPRLPAAGGGLILLVAYAGLTWWATSRSGVPSLGAAGAMLLLAGVLFQFAAKWCFGELFRDGVQRSGRELGHGPAFRAALVGAGVARLIPAGGAVTPVAMAWSVKRETEGVSGAALRATVLNYAALLIGTGGGLLWITGRFAETSARGHTAAAGALMLGVGTVLLVGSSRLSILTRLAPNKWRERVSAVLVDHSVDRRALLLLTARVAFEAAALGMTLAAFGVTLSPSRTIAAFGIAQLVGGLPGTPGGLGVTEAGLVGVLAFFGVPTATGLGPVLVFRVISYWLPALAGALAGGSSFLRLRSARHQRL